MLTIALPKGSLQQKTLELFRRAGINLTDPTRQHWIEIGHELVQTIVWMRPRHIPEAICDGLVDGGITGQDCRNEWFYTGNNGKSKHQLKSWITLPYSKRSFKPDQIALIASLDEIKYPTSDEIFTEFPNWTTRCLCKGARVVHSRGSVEAFVPRRYRFGVTVVETGESLAANGLKVVRVLDTSSPELYSLNQLPESKQVALSQLAKLLKGALRFES